MALERGVRLDYRDWWRFKSRLVKGSPGECGPLPPSFVFFAPRLSLRAHLVVPLSLYAGTFSSEPETPFQVDEKLLYARLERKAKKEQQARERNSNA